MFVDALLQITDFTQEELEIIQKCGKENFFPKNAFLLKEGRTCREIHFIKDGVIRRFFLSKGKEITTYIACDGNVVASLKSFINQAPSTESLQSITDTHTLSISYEKMQELYKVIPKWQTASRYLAEQNYICFYDKLMGMHHVKAKERYLTFLKTAHPKILQNTPVQYIASYLGIQPESLSRIRKEIS